MKVFCVLLLARPLLAAPVCPTPAEICAWLEERTGYRVSVDFATGLEACLMMSEDCPYTSNEAAVEDILTKTGIEIPVEFLDGVFTCYTDKNKCQRGWFGSATAVEAEFGVAVPQEVIDIVKICMFHIYD